MLIRTEINTNEHLLDEDDGPGASVISSNIYVQADGATPSEKQAIRNVVETFYKNLSVELKKIR